MSDYELFCILAAMAFAIAFFNQRLAHLQELLAHLAISATYECEMDLGVR